VMGGQTGRVISIINFFALFFSPGVALVFSPIYLEGSIINNQFFVCEKNEELERPRSHHQRSKEPKHQKWQVKSHTGCTVKIRVRKNKNKSLLAVLDHSLSKDITGAPVEEGRSGPFVLTLT